MMPIPMLIVVSAQALTDLCRMGRTDRVYPIESALACLNAPPLKDETFKQNQQSVEALVELHVFQELAAAPPAEYAHLSVDIQAGLQAIREKYQEPQQHGVAAFDYFSELSGLFLKLKDPHTLFVKPNFFKHFQVYFPFEFRYQDGQFYTARYPDDTNYGKIAQYYEDLHGPLDLNEEDPVFHINGLEPLEYFRDQANMYDFSSKNEHGRVNSLLSGAFYSQRLDIYNVRAPSDRSVTILYLSGAERTYHFVVHSNISIESSADAVDRYNNETGKAPPYQSRVLRRERTERRLFEHVEPLVHAKPPAPAQNGLTAVLTSGGFFTLYTRGAADFVLRVESFDAGENVTGALQDIEKLAKHLAANMRGDSKLYIDVAGNGGGWVSLGHLLFNGLFYRNYPIYGRYNFRKSELAEILLRSGSDFSNMHRFNWITGETMSDVSTQQAPDTDWYNKDVKYKGGVFTDYFGMDDDQNPQIARYSQEIYGASVDLNPDQVILITDGMCGSTCACFAKHIRQAGLAKVVGLGGIPGSKDTFDVASFAGGAVMSSTEYEAAVVQIMEEKRKYVEDEDVEKIKKYWLPHDGYFRFAHLAIYSFDTLEDPGTPLEYRSLPVDTIVAYYPTFSTVQTAKGLEERVAVAAAAESAIQAYGTVCKEQGNVVYRSNGDACTMFQASYGYYPDSGTRTNFTVLRRADQFYVPIEGPHLSPGAIAGIACAAIAITGIFGLVIYFAVRRSRRAAAHNDETEALARSDE